MHLSARRPSGTAALSEAPAYEVGRSGRILAVNPAMTALLGVPADEIVGRPLSTFVAEIDSSAADRLAGSGGPLTWDLAAADRTLRFTEVVLDGDLVSERLGIGVDISDLVDAVTSLEHTERWYRSLIRHSRSASVVVDEAGRIVHVTAAAAQLLAVDSGEIVGAPAASIEGIDEAATRGSAVLSVGGRTLTAVAHEMTDDATGSGCVVVLAADPTGASAGTDPLTGLPDRSGLHAAIDGALARSSRVDRFIALLFIDLDRFKLVNDVHGHAAGDRLLVSVARRLSGLTRSGETVARISGDEFVLVLENVGTKREAELAGERVVQAVREPIDIGRTEAQVGASVGIAMGGAGDDVDDLMAQADAAMYQAKNSGRSRVVYFSEEMRQATDRQLRVEHDLRQAIEDDGLTLHYVPIVDLGSGRIVGLEALARWIHPERGLVPPSEFISLAERSGLITAVGEWSIRQACRDLSRWNRSKRGPNIGVSVNVSDLHFTQPSLLRVVEASVSANALTRGSLTLEINESAILRDPEMATRQLGELDRMGVRASLDDFGTGSASLHYLNTFDLAEVKLDRALVSKVPRYGDDLAIVSSIISLADALGFGLVAEGVETMEQRQILLDAGCEIGQGYLFGRAMPPEELADSVNRGVVAVEAVPR